MEGKKCCPFGCGFALGISWAIGVAIIGVANRYHSSFGNDFLQVLSSIYHGYHVGWGLKNLAIGVGWAFANGFVGGFVLALVGGIFSGKKCDKSA